MKIDEIINFIVVNKQTNSLYSLIANGQHRATSLGHDTWKTLIGPQAFLQHKCSKEGFNTKMTLLKQELVSLVSTKTTAVTRVSSSIEEDIMMTPTRVETRLHSYTF